MLKEIFIIFCLWVWIVKSMGAQNKNEPQKLLAESLHSGVKNFYSSKESNLQILTSVRCENSESVENILSKVLANQTEITFTVGSFENFSTLNETKSSNLILIDSLESFEKICGKTNPKSFNMKKLFTVASLKFLNEHEIQKIFNFFMSRLVVDVNLLNPNKNSIDLFTFFPFNINGQCEDTKPVKINFFSKNWENENFMLEKSRNMHGCPLRIGASGSSAEPGVIITREENGIFDLKGFEKEIFDELSKRINFKSIYKIFLNSVGKVFRNGTATEIFGEVLENRLDLMIGTTSLQLRRAQFLSFTTCYAMTSLCLVGNFVLNYLLKIIFFMLFSPSR